MHGIGLKNDSLVTFSRYRNPVAREQFDNLTSPPGLFGSILFEMKQTNKILFFLKFSLLLSLFFPPYLFLLFIFYRSFQFVFSNLNSLDIYTILLLIYTRTLLTVLVLSLPKLCSLTQVIESRSYLKSRNIDFRYTNQYYALILVIILLASLPNFLFIIFFNSSFMSDDFINTIDWSYRFLILIMLLSGSFLVAFPHLIAKSFGIHMHTHFTDKGIKIHGRWRGQKYQMNYLANDISSFVLVTVLYSELLAYYETRPAFLVPKKPLPEDISILYLRDRFGSLHLCSYFIQGKQLVQDTQALLIKHYPEVKLEIVKDKEVKDLRGFPYKSLSFLVSNKTFDALKTIFFYPRFIKPLKKEKLPMSNISPLASEESIKIENNANTSLKNPSIWRFLSNDYPSADIEVVFTAAIPMIITFILMPLSAFVMLFWFILREVNDMRAYDLFEMSLLLPPVILGIINGFVSMPKKWYHPGLIYVCPLLIILITALNMLYFY